jgi:hypothetical protein
MNLSIIATGLCKSSLMCARAGKSGHASSVETLDPRARRKVVWE